MNYKQLLVLIALTITLASCGKDDKRLEEVSGIQGQKNAEKQVEEENKNLAAKAAQAEEDLKLQTAFYLAFVGNYEGEVNILGTKSSLEVSIQPYYLPTYSTRVRTLEAIDNDIKNVSLTVTIKHHAANATSVQSPCKIIGAKPDIKSGVMYLSSTECPSSYQFFISKDAQESDDLSGEAQEYSQEIYSTEQEKEFLFLKGFINPGATTGRYKITLKRIVDKN